MTSQTLSMAPDAYQLSIVEKGVRHILCKVFVDVTLPLATQMRGALNALVESEQLRTLLIDLRGVRNITSNGATYNYIHDTLGKTQYRRNIVAMLVDKGDNSHAFAETVFINSGHTTKVFNEENEALIWLKDRVENQNNDAQN